MRTFITYFLLTTINLTVLGQTAINEDGSTAHASARLDVSSTTKGVLFPSLTNAQRDAIPSPTSGLMIFNSETECYNYYNGNKWCEIDTTVIADPAVNPAGSENENGVGIGIDDPDNSAILHVFATNKGVLAPRADNDISSPTEGLFYYSNGNFLRYYNGTSWESIAGTILTDGATGNGTLDGVAFGKSTVDTSAKMEVYATDKGLLIPRLTNAQRDAINSPADGLMIYNTTNHAFQYHSNNIWYEWKNNGTDYGTANYPGTSCEDILTFNPSATDGNFYIDPDGNGGINPFECECDMSTDGGGWIVMELDQSDQIFIHSYSSTNHVYKSAGNEYDNYDQISDESIKENSGGYAGTWPQTNQVTLDYYNPATALNFTADQIDAIRDIVDQLSSTTRMVALVSDDDSPGYDPHEVVAYDTADNTINLTFGGTGNNIWGAWKWNTSEGGGSTLTGTGNTGGEWPNLPTGYILPSKIDLTLKSGGGVIWGYENASILVK